MPSFASSRVASCCRSTGNVSLGQSTIIRRSFSEIGHGRISFERNTAFMKFASSQPFTNFDSMRIVLPVIRCLILPCWL
ncbi:hypothetical protein D3C78_1794580 [compost metagenome]